MQPGCNKQVNAHNDLCYSDDGVQSVDNTADPQLLTAAFTIGLPRTITFECMTKVVLGGKGIISWSKTDPKHFVESELDDRSMLVLEASDDKLIKSQPGKGVIYKTSIVSIFVVTTF